MSRDRVAGLIRNLVALAIAAGICFALLRNDFIQVSALKGSLADHPLYVVMFGICQIFVILLSAARFKALLDLLLIETTRWRVVKANAVAQGLGQWMPASMAFIEVLRIGILSRVKARNGDSRWKAIAFGAALDRVLAQCVMFLLGGAFSLIFVLAFSADNPHRSLATVLGLCSLTAGLAILAILFAYDQIVALVEARFSGTCFGAKMSRVLAKAGFSQHLRSIAESMGRVRKSPGSIFLCVCYSVGVILVTCFALQISALLLKLEVNMVAFAAILPLLSVLSILPLGFAGFGGAQVAAMGLLSVFGYSMEIGASVTFVYAALSLLVNSLLITPLLFSVPKWIRSAFVQR